MFARFNENPAMTLRVIKETKRYGWTDGQRENSIPTPIKVFGGYKNCYLTVCSLVSRIGKQAVSSGAMKRPVEIDLSFLGVCFIRQKVSTAKNFSLLLF